REWAHGRYYGEKINDLLREYIVEKLTKEGYQAVAPSLSVSWKRVDSSPVGLASTWSERHAAYAAGMGTFSLSDGLITSRGIAHRCGTVIVNTAIEPDERKYSGPYDYCLWYSGDECQVCIKRCPAGAITNKGHDKNKCFEYIRNKVMPTVNPIYGVDIPSCGLCQTRVPCENRIPG
ncbi:MAG: epoxyqueuosine reductase, partial [Bacillota bacterium]|nr:epoxyqueuosine reductase [Bacillota bacterium]